MLLTQTHAYAQTDFIKTDLTGFIYPLFPPDQLKPFYGPKFSLGYEHGFKNPHFAIAAYLNYGYTPSYGTSQLSFLNYISGGSTRKGIFMFNDFRYYHLFRKKEYLQFKHKIASGFFVGIYTGLMYVNEGVYTVHGNYPADSPPLGLVDSYYLWEYGAGGLLGYKQMIGKHFFAEGLAGIAFGWSNIKSVRSVPGDERDSRYLDLYRLELSAGYAF